MKRVRASNKFQRWLLIGADSVIKQYFAIKQDRLIEQREEELRYPWKPGDENVGGGKSSTTGASKQELTVEKLESDPLLNQYREVVDKVERALNGLDYTGRVIINTMYDCSDKASTGRYSDKEVAEMLDADIKTVVTTRKGFIAEVARLV